MSSLMIIYEKLNKARQTWTDVSSANKWSDF